MNDLPRRRRRRPAVDEDPSEDTGVEMQQDTAAVEQPASVATAIPSAAPATAQMSSKDAAAQRAAQILEHNKGANEGTDEFYIDPSIVPEGWDYQWKRRTVNNQEDPAYQVQLQQGGWTPVPATRHPEMMPRGSTYETIERKGQTLMEVPKSITDRARMLEQRKALMQVRVKEEQLGVAPGPGQFERGTHPQAKPVINKAYEAIPIPKD